jgi:hypothetical protein
MHIGPPGDSEQKPNVPEESTLLLLDRHVGWASLMGSPSLPRGPRPG